MAHIRLFLTEDLTRPLLSRRETTVAELYAAGKSYKQIARRLHVSPATVRNQIASVFRKLEVHSKAQLGMQLARFFDHQNKQASANCPTGADSGNPGNSCSSYTCSDYPGFDYCPGRVQARTEAELWQLIKIHAAVEHGESPSNWTAEEIRTIRALIKPCS